MKCGACGFDLPAPEAACPVCTAYAAGRASAIAPTSAAAPTRHGRKLAVLALVVLCVLGVGVFALRSQGGLLRRTDVAAAHVPILGSAGGAKNVPNMVAFGDAGPQHLLGVQGQGSPPSDLLRSTGESPKTTPLAAEGTTPTPSLLRTDSQGAKPVLQDVAGMPDDVRKWLEHLERIEQQRNALASAQMMQAVSTMAKLQADDLTGMMDDGDGDDSEAAANKKMADRANTYIGDTDGMRKAWSDLMIQFHSLPPPAECMGIKTNYDQVVGSTGTMMLEIVNAVRSASQNRSGALATLMAMQGKSTERIDRPARESDDGVQKVCNHYATKKWFDIKSDIGSGLLTKLGF